MARLLVQAALDPPTDLDVTVSCPRCAEHVPGVFDQVHDEVWVDWHPWSMGVTDQISCPASGAMFSTGLLGGSIVN